MNDHALDTTPTGAEALLACVTEQAYPAWLDAQATAVQRRLKEARFAPEVGNVCWLPAKDDVARVLAVVDPSPLASLSGLPTRLPEGRYRLEAPVEGEAGFLAVLGWGLGAYRYERYRAAKRRPARLLVPETVDTAELAAELGAVALVRDLINTPAADMLPEHLEAATRALAAEFGAEVECVTGDALLAANHPTIHAVGRASASAPRLIELRWGEPGQPRVALVGKGVCFDSGGLNIKPASGMRLMKKDMGGAAHVLGLARLIMAARLPVQLQVLVPAVENAIAGNAFRPGDILRTRKGLSVEIDNTDAEGRLVLCDALARACETRPALIMDFATLTGAARVALGTELPAMFCNDDALAGELLAAAAAVADPLWRMPLHAAYRGMLDSSVADLLNSANSPYAGAITAALFLERFVAPGIPWVHFDVMAWNPSSKPGRPEGGEAMGLRASYEALRRRFGGG
ncbi:MAG: leucyl aminopeptidase family protein [Gammaproteobacteria bacterium]|nr:leucyl aminopeptidase family protein [Gammaproteobacteria bacterium]TVQ43298.1 MAG: leucyl aminopeptidase family protein [Gammaproteobacteria bacterium]